MEKIEIPKIKVYAKLDKNKVVNEINSSIFIQDTTGWMQIGEGVGDKYSHAQSQYLEKGLIDEKGRYNYKYDNVLLELKEEEKKTLFPETPKEPTELDQLKLQLISIQEYVLNKEFQELKREGGLK